MKLSVLLSSLKQVAEIDIDERTHKDGTKVFIFSSLRPFPQFEHVWYPIVVLAGQEDVDDDEVEAMLRHLWMFQLNLIPERPDPNAN